jgi:hypothetical protein
MECTSYMRMPLYFNVWKLWQEYGENCIMNFTTHLPLFTNIFRWSNQGEWDGWDGQQMRNLYINLIRMCGGKIPHRRIRHTQEDTINLDPKKYGVSMWTEFNWLRTASSGRIMNFMSLRMYGISWIAKELSAYPEGLCPPQFRYQIPFIRHVSYTTWLTQTINVFATVNIQTSCMTVKW